MANTPPPAHSTSDYSQYVNDPIGYARDVLGVQHITDDQKRIMEAILEPPYRVLVKSGHGIGKSFLAAMIVNWWYDTRDPSVAITTAPTARDVNDILWTEIRLQRQRANLSSDFIGPSAPEMSTGKEHYAKGYTATTGESFQGRHRPRQLFVFDEAEGVDAMYWKTANTMFQPDGTNGFLAILNPTTTTSQSFQEERALGADGERKWRVFQVSSLDHPNIAAGLRGEPDVVPNAVSLSQVNDWLGDWFEQVNTDEVVPETDVEFPLGSGKFWRPGPDGESRVLGRRPSAGSYGVWSESLWAQSAFRKDQLQSAPDDMPEIGGDVARYGDDRTEIHIRCGPVSLHHEDHGGWSVTRTAERIMYLAEEWAKWRNSTRDVNYAQITGKDILIKIDDTGVGGGVTDILASNGYQVVPVNSGNSAPDAVRYQRVRDQLWFETVARARAGKLDLTRLDRKRLAKLEAQAMAPVKTPMPDRRWRVESKEDTKKKIGRSPDGMDALNLAYYSAGVGGGAEWVSSSNAHRSWRERTKG